MAESAGDTTTIDSLLKDLGGCGLFQVILVSIAVLGQISSYLSNFFMAFGIINPGWRCLDNTSNTDYPTNWTETILTTIVTRPAEDNGTSDYMTDSCDGFESCQHVQFNPEASTIVTEWGLVCGKSWIANIIITIQMAGRFLGLLFVGYIGDRFGRKTTLHVFLAIQAVLLLLLVLSNSWQMYAMVFFILGFVTSFNSLSEVLQTEFVIPKWRIRVMSLPTWPITITLFAIMAMLTRNWKTLKIMECVMTAIAFIPLFWVPKSLRWLTVNNNKKDALEVVRKISKYNKTEKPTEYTIDSLLPKQGEKEKSATLLGLFRKDYRLSTSLIGLMFFSVDLTYYGISFGISSLPGNVYENMLILTAAEIPANFIPIIVADIFGRKKSIFTFNLMFASFLMGVVVTDRIASEDVKPIAILVLIVLAKIYANASWFTLATWTMEIYPTVARGTIYSFGRLMSISGAALAPLLIPSAPNTLYICYLVMAILNGLMSIAVLFLPETKGKILRNTWDDESGEERHDVKHGEKDTVA